MSSYNDFAYVYDALTRDVDYEKRTDYLCSLFLKHDRLPTLLLDVACGTGNFSTEFARRGMQVIGVDKSSDMLSVARDKNTGGTDVLYLCQAAEDIELYGTVDGAVCCLDSINHITDKNTLKKAFKRISLFLEKDRLFIFDVNTEYKHERVLGDNTFVSEQDGVYCVWQNFYDKRRKVTDIMIDIFAEENGVYNRFCEDFSERFYSDGELRQLLSAAGLKTEAVYAEMTDTSPEKDSQRIIYVTRKV